MGSVKDLEVLNPVQGNSPGRGRFIYSDRYSVFDWGEMPDKIPHKGEALCLLSAYFFEKLAEWGIKSHYRGLVEDGEVKYLRDLTGPSAVMEVSLVRVIEPEYRDGAYDYGNYNSTLTNCLIPLEIIYRNTLPGSSSFRRRAEKGAIDIGDYGLERLPEPGVELEEPIFDVSTKLESSDRYISWQEAGEIACLQDSEFRAIMKVLKEVNSLITAEVENAGLKNLDGKIELAFDHKRDLMVVDAVGTPDECRFSYEDLSISKEVIREYYRGTAWQREVSRAKKEGGPEWRRRVSSEPGSLPEDIRGLVAAMYMACANEITGREWFPEIPPLAEIAEKLRKF